MGKLDWSRPKMAGAFIVCIVLAIILAIASLVVLGPLGLLVWFGFGLGFVIATLRPRVIIDTEGETGP